MKFLKISIIALSMGIFVTACNNNVHCPPSAADSSATSATAANPSGDTGTAVTATNPDSNAASAATESGTGTNTAAVNHRNGKRVNGKYANTKDSTMANVKKREANFTNGTGADNPGR